MFGKKFLINSRSFSSFSLFLHSSQSSQNRTHLPLTPPNTNPVARRRRRRESKWMSWNTTTKKTRPNFYVLISNKRASLSFSGARVDDEKGEKTSKHIMMLWVVFMFGSISNSSSESRLNFPTLCWAMRMCCVLCCVWLTNYKQLLEYNKASNAMMLSDFELLMRNYSSHPVQANSSHPCKLFDFSVMLAANTHCV